MLATLITSKLSLLLTLKLSAGRPMTPKETCPLRNSSLIAAGLFRSPIGNDQINLEKHNVHCVLSLMAALK